MARRAVGGFFKKDAKVFAVVFGQCIQDESHFLVHFEADLGRHAHIVLGVETFGFEEAAAAFINGV